MKKSIRKIYLLALIASIGLHWAQAQQSVARQWNEALLQSIRQDFARPPVHARNLFHTSIALYDAWAAYDTVAQTYLLGKTIGNYTCPFDGVPAPADVQAAREKAMSYAAYRVLRARFVNSPNAVVAYARFDTLMAHLGYDFTYAATDYQSGDPAALGNYLGQCVIQMGLQDGANEAGNYLSLYYSPVNPPLVVEEPGDPSILDPNRWQPLKLTVAIDQNGNPIPATQTAQSPEWGNVQPFALTDADLTIFQRGGHDYRVYHDPGPFPLLDTADGGGLSDEYRWNFQLVTVWSSHLDPNDGVMWDISPASLGNNASYPQTLAEMHDFYNLTDGGDSGLGRSVNPKTGLPYAPQMVPRGDYTRVLAQFWADGPNSETPPGHWFSILNYVSDDPDFVKKYNGKGPVLDNLEWDVKAYFSLGAAVHDAAVSAWGIKGWYDGVRPVSALRYMADHGQSTDPGLPSFDPAGVSLQPGFIELVLAGDPLAGPNNENVGKIKFYAWRGPLTVSDPVNQIAGVDWILAENWWPYQRKTFVTPPFPGYISGHSTYSRAAAETLTLLTGDEYFPGGMGEFHIAANSGFLGLEKGPSVDVTLQWATYRDASDQTSLSRIWGGIHPPADDIPGRLIGAEVGQDAFYLARKYFYADADEDGFYNYEDCDDANATVYPGAAELCDGLDNDCNGLADDLPIFAYFLDNDGDGFGDAASELDTCLTDAPAGYAANNLDCDDADAAFNPNAAELCDGLDNDCNGLTDDLPIFAYFLDNDGDGFGDAASELDTCLTAAPAGYAANNLDCDDADAAFNPNAAELCDGLDNDCNGLADDLPIFAYFLDNDGDGFGDAASELDTCLTAAPAGYASNNLDCDDTDAAFNPAAAELCDGLDNDCDGLADEELEIFVYFADADGDGFGDLVNPLETCLDTLPAGYVLDSQDCDDENFNVYPGAIEIADGLDNDCDGLTDETTATADPSRSLVRIYPNPVQQQLSLRIDPAFSGALQLRLATAAGQILRDELLRPGEHTAILDCRSLEAGLYVLHITDPQNGQIRLFKVVKM